MLNAATSQFDTPRLNLIGGMHAARWCARTKDLFAMERPTWADWSKQNASSRAQRRTPSGLTPSQTTAMVVDPPPKAKGRAPHRHRLAAVSGNAVAIGDDLKDARRQKGSAGAPHDCGQMGGRNLERRGDRPDPLATDAVTTGHSARDRWQAQPMWEIGGPARRRPRSAAGTGAHRIGLARGRCVANIGKAMFAWRLDAATHHVGGGSFRESRVEPTTT